VLEREGGPLRRTLDPFNASSATADPVAEELLRLGVDVQLPSARLSLDSGRVLSRAEEQQVKQARARGAPEPRSAAQ
jgi:hypothetical protein